MATHCYNVGIATKYGVFKAIMIEQVYWWVHKNECEEDETMMHEGRVWCRASAKGFNKYLPYIDPQKIGRILRELEKEGKIIVGNFNNKATNQTKWYTFTDTFKKELEDAGYDFSKMKIGIFKNEKSNNNSIINNPINNKEYNIQEERKRLSNDNQKASDELFLKFWESYGYKKGKDKAVKAWNRLNKKEKDAAIKCIPVYKEDCLKHDRNMKYPSTYLNGKTWEDDFDCDGKVSDGEGFADLPEGLTQQEWERANYWMIVNIPRLSGSISAEMHLRMVKMTHSKADVYAAILKEIEASDYDDDLMPEFERLCNTKYKERIEA